MYFTSWIKSHLHQLNIYDIASFYVHDCIRSIFGIMSWTVRPHVPSQDGTTLCLHNEEKASLDVLPCRINTWVQVIAHMSVVRCFTNGLHLESSQDLMHGYWEILETLRMRSLGMSGDLHTVNVLAYLVHLCKGWACECNCSRQVEIPCWSTPKNRLTVPPATV